jgi:Kef-type K+ transport system membrane component KefB
MRILLECVMISNALLFFFGALQHAGVSIGYFHEPRIIPATIVESLCGLSLVWGVAALFGHSPVEWRTAIIANLVPLGGVLLGMAALAAGRGPRTASNDLYHHIMLALIVTALLLIFVARSTLNRS